MRRDASNQVRGALKVFGIVLPPGRLSTFDRLAREHIGVRAELSAFVEPLLAAWRSLGEQVAVLDRHIRKIARENPIVKNLTSVPGIGVSIGLAYVATIDDQSRFKKSRNVGAHLGLAPRRFQSGEVDRQGSISKCGDPLLRHYLYEAAGVLLTRTQRWSTLKAWGVRLAQRIGASKAKIAVARKLAIIMHRMWRTGESFRWGSIEEATV
jgi:transposase